jgi:hypothetical protein
MASSTISAVGIKKKSQKVSAIKTKHYIKDEWYKLPVETRLKIRKLHEDNKKQQIASLSSSEIDATTAANTVKNASTILNINVFNPQ